MTLHIDVQHLEHTRGHNKFYEVWRFGQFRGATPSPVFGTTWVARYGPIGGAHPALKLYVAVDPVATIREKKQKGYVRAGGYTFDLDALPPLDIAQARAIIDEALGVVHVPDILTSLTAIAASLKGPA